MTQAFIYWKQGLYLADVNSEYHAKYEEFEFILDPRDYVDPSTFPDMSTPERIKVQSLRSLLRYILNPYQKRHIDISPSEISTLISIFPKEEKKIRHNVSKGSLKWKIFYELMSNLEFYVNNYNRDMMWLAMCYRYPNYPNREIIDNFLLANNIPPDISNLSMVEQVRFRKSFPYAWIGKDFPQEWILENNRIFENQALWLSDPRPWKKQIETDNTHLKLPDLISYGTGPTILHGFRLSDSRAFSQYDQYIRLMDNIPPLPRPVILFRKYNESPFIRENDEIITAVFSQNVYIHDRLEPSDYNLIISYPANHKFIVPLFHQERKLMVVTYPGEILKVVRTEGKDIYCKFVEYDSYRIQDELHPPHMLTDDMDTFPPVTPID